MTETEIPKAAVSILIRNAGTPRAEVLLGRRAARPDDPWSGQIAFPGGRREPTDADLLDTALRELTEESGLSLTREDLTGKLPTAHAGRLTGIWMAVEPWLFLGDFPDAPGGDGEMVEWAWIPLTLLDDASARVPSPAEGYPGIRTSLGTLWGMTLRTLEALWQNPLLSVRRMLLDFDGTFYPRDHDLFRIIDTRISLYVARCKKLTDEEGDKRRQELYQQHGNTLHGLMFEGLKDPDDFLRFVFDLPDDVFPAPAPEIGAALLRIGLPADIFTNAEDSYVRRCLRLMQLGEWTGAIHDLPSFGYDCKPHHAVFEMVKTRHPEPAGEVVFVDDQPDNCSTGRETGYRTVLVRKAFPDWDKADFRIGSLPELPRILLPHLGA